MILAADFALGGIAALIIIAMILALFLADKAGRL